MGYSDYQWPTVDTAVFSDIILENGGRKIFYDGTKTSEIWKILNISKTDMIY